MTLNSEAGLVRSKIDEFLASDSNRLGIDDERLWDPALVGFAAGDDPLFAEIKAAIGDFYWTPAEAFALAFPGQAFSDDELTVVAWVLPQTQATRRDPAMEAAQPSRRWSYSKKFGEDVEREFQDYMTAALAGGGIDAAAPERLPDWRVNPDWGFASRWSHRHAAHAAGLGTFGLCGGLITPVGKAMRCLSLVVRAPIEPTPRPYHGLHDYCLFYARGTCGRCMERCPSGAITPQGHDTRVCRDYLSNVTKPWVEKTFGFTGRAFDTNACGLCQTGVPCEAGIPRRLR